MAQDDLMTPFGVPPRGILGKSVPPSISCLPLPTAQVFVDPLRKDVQELLEEFVQQWTTAVNNAEEAVAAGNNDEGTSSATTDALVAVANGPVYSFETIWMKRGWSYVQLVCGEDEIPRAAFFDTIFRVFQEHLLPLLETSETAHTVSTQLHGVAALFGMYLLWGTQPRMERIWTSVREDPDNGVKDKERVWIEIDLYNAMMRLPETAQAALRLSPQLEAALRQLHSASSSSQQTTSSESFPPYVAPIADVTQVLRVMTDTLSDEEYAQRHAIQSAGTVESLKFAVGASKVEEHEASTSAQAGTRRDKGKGKARDQAPEQGQTADSSTDQPPHTTAGRAPTPLPRTGSAFLIMPPSTLKTRPVIPDNVCVLDTDDVRLSGKYGRMKKRKVDDTAGDSEGTVEATGADGPDESDGLARGLVPSELVRSIIQARLHASSDYEAVLSAVTGSAASTSAASPTGKVPVLEIDEPPIEELPKGKRHGGTWKDAKIAGWDRLKSRALGGESQEQDDEEQEGEANDVDTYKGIMTLKDLEDVRQRYAEARNEALRDWGQGAGDDDDSSEAMEGNSSDEDSRGSLTGPQILAMARDRTVQRMKDAKAQKENEGGAVDN